MPSRHFSCQTSGLLLLDITDLVQFLRNLGLLLLTVEEAVTCKRSLWLEAAISQFVGAKDTRDAAIVELGAKGTADPISIVSSGRCNLRVRTWHRTRGLCDILRNASSQTKVAYLDTTRLCYEHIAWLEVPMHQICSLQEMRCAQKIVDQYFDLIIFELNVLVMVEDLPQVLFLPIHD